MLAQNPERSFDALVHLRDDASQPAEQRLAAVVALTHLGVPANGEQVAAIASGEEDAMFAFLVRLDALWPVGSELPTAIRGAIGKALTGDSEAAADHAASAAQRHGLREFGDVLFERYAKPGQNFRALAALDPSPRVFEFLVRGIRQWKYDEVEDDDPRESAAIGLMDLAAATGDAAMRARALDEVIEYFANRQQEAGGGTIACIQIASSLRPTELAEGLLARLADSARDQTVREWAANALDELRAALKPAAAVDVRALAVYRRHGVIGDAEASGTSPLPLPDDQKKAVFEVPPAVEALARLGRYIFLERSAERVPYRHDWIILKLAAQLAAGFAPEAVMETSRPLDPNDDSGVPAEYHVQFIHAGRLYRFDPPDLEYQYNVPAVVEAVNRALADAGRADRFVPYRFDSSAIEYLIGPPDHLAAAAAEQGIELQPGDG